MEFGDAVRSRRMVRSYVDTPVEAEAIARILEAGRRAPSAGNTRGVHFVVVTDADVRTAIARSAGEDAWVARGKAAWLTSAPVHIVLVADPLAYEHRYDQRDKDASHARRSTGEWVVPWWWVDAGAALMALLLASVDEDLVAGFLGGHAFEGLHPIIGLPAEAELVGVVTIGIPGPDDVVTGSAVGGPPSSDEVVHHERWDS